jgi:uncharacterized membrane-anchored protein
MTNSHLHDAGMIGSGITLTSGLMAWFGDNANAIGAIVAVVSLILTTVFLLLNYRLNKQRLAFDRRHIDELKDMK